MTYNEVKVMFNSEWINKICDDLDNPSEFVKSNKADILETLMFCIRQSVGDMDIPVNKKYKEAYEFVQMEWIIELSTVVDFLKK